MNLMCWKFYQNTRKCQKKCIGINKIRNSRMTDLTSLFRFSSSQGNFLRSFLFRPSARKRIIFTPPPVFIIDNIIFLQPPHKIVIFLYSLTFNLFAPLMWRGNFSLPALVIRLFSQITQLPFRVMSIVCAYDDESRVEARWMKNLFVAGLR